MQSLTPSQNRAATTLEGDLAISAGAGSGKTRVLAYRFAQALAPQGSREAVGLDSVLTITFTAKAAGEISERVRRVLLASGLVEDARRVDEAWISTIHGFCSRLVRRHSLEVGVSPRFQTADEVVSAVLRGEAWEQCARKLVDSDEQVESLFDLFGATCIRTSVFEVVDQLRAMGARPNDASIGRGSLTDTMSRAAREYLDLAEAISDLNPTPPRLASVETLRAFGMRLQAGDEDAAHEIAACSKPWKNDSRNGIDGARAQEAREHLITCVREREYAWIPAAFLRLIGAFDEAYARVKREREMLDFDDLQERAAELLGDERLAAVYRARFRLLMVDEFQDTNELQMRVIEPLRDNNLCIVGDDKQSIYGWRYADVGVFERIRAQADTAETLDANFRSHAEVLAFANELFSADPFWNDYVRLDARREDPMLVPWPEDDPRVELMLVDVAGACAADAAASEARAVAERISSLVAGGVEPGDIAVLLRSATFADEYAAALASRGIDVVQGAGGSFFKSAAVWDIRAVLRVIALPHDDEALVRVLAGDLAGLSADALWAIRNATAKESALWEGARRVVETGCADLGAADGEALERAVGILDSLAVRAGRLGLAQLIREAINEFDYDLTVIASGPGGDAAWANVLKLLRMAEAFEQTQEPDVLAFERYLELRETHAAREAEGVVLANGQGAVRIMTVHSAKGLEFPVVFVPDLGRKIADASRARFMVGRSAQNGPIQLGFKMPDDKGGLSADSTGRAVLRAEHQAASLAEEKRVFYVACTRAGEALILSGTTGTKGSRLDWLPADLVHTAGDDTVWLGEARVRRRWVEPGEDPGSAAPGEPIADVARVPEGAPAIEDSPDEPGHAVPQCDSNLLVPRRISYSSLREYHLCRLRFYARHVLGLRVERFENEGIATRFGSAVHAALQRWTGDGVADADLDAVARNFELAEQERDRCSRAVRAFSDSDVAIRIQQGERIGREVPFSVGLNGTRLEGEIDLISWFGTEALIVDYKTGRDELEAGTLEAYHAQAQCYALAAFAAGATHVHAVFMRLERDEETYRFDFDVAQRAELTGSIQAVVDEMAAGAYEPLERYDHAACSSCPAYGGLCDVRSSRTAGASS